MKRRPQRMAVPRLALEPRIVFDAAFASIAATTLVDTPAVVTGGNSGTGMEAFGGYAGGQIVATDVDGLSDGTVFELSSAPAKGRVIYLEPALGIWTYTPYPDVNGTDTFMVSITDDLGGVTLCTVTVDITPEDDTPDATMRVPRDGTAVVVDLPSGQNFGTGQQVLSPAQNFESSPLTGFSFGVSSGIAVAAGPNQVSVSWSNPAYTGTESFTYFVDTPYGEREEATVTVTSYDLPTVVAPSSQTVSVYRELPLQGLSAFAISDDDGDIQWVSVSVDKGSVTVDLQGGAYIAGGSRGTGAFIIAGTQAGIADTLGTLRYTPAVTGLATITVTAQDMDGMSTASVGIDVFDPVSGALTMPTDLTIAEDEPYAFQSGEISIDAVGAESVTVSFNPTRASVNLPATISGTQAEVNALLATLVLTPSPDYVGQGALSLTVTLADQQGVFGSTNGYMIYTTTQVQDGVNDTVYVSRGGTVSFNVLQGSGGASADTFIDPYRAMGPVGTPLGGTLTAGASPGDFVFEHDGSYSGPMTFQYSVWSGLITDGIEFIEYVGHLESATVTIVLSDAPGHQVPQATTVPEDAQLAFTGPDAVQVTDPDSNVSSVAVSVAHGRLTVSTAGGAGLGSGANGTSAFTLTGTQAQINDALATLRYLGDADWHGSDMLFLLTTDALGGSSSATVPITVTPVADIANDTAMTNVDTPKSITTASLLANDSFEGSAVVTSVDTPVNGTVTLVNGSVLFTPAPGFTGAASFNYNVTSAGLTETATVQVTVTDVDHSTVVTGGTTGSGQEDAALPISATLQASDADGLNDGSVFAVTVLPAHGTAVIDAATGAWRYRPNADWNGDDRFTVTITDDTGSATTQVIRVHVSPVADIVDDAFDLDEDRALELTPAQLLANDTFEGSPVVVGVDGALNGVVSFAGGRITFTPDANFHGEAGFRYTVLSGGVTETASVRINVGEVDDPTDVTGGTDGGSAEDPLAPITGTLVAADADGLTGAGRFTLASQAQHGTASIDGASGTWRYTPVADYYGADAFTVRITDDDGHSILQVVTVNVSPVVDIAPDSLSTPEDTPLVFGATQLLANDTFEGDPAVTGVGGATHGTVTLVAGVVRFTPDPGFHGEAGFSYTVTSGGVDETSYVTVDVLSVDDPTLVTGGLAGSGIEDAREPVSGRILATDADGLQGDAAFAISRAAGHGSVTIDPRTGAWTYTPLADYNGADAFVVTVTDDEGHPSEVLVEVVIAPEADIAPDALRTEEDQGMSFGTSDLLANDAFEGSPVVVAVGGAQHGAVSLDAGRITFTPDPGFVGTASFRYTTESAGTLESATVTVQVDAVSRPGRTDEARLAPLPSAPERLVIEGENRVYVQHVVRAEPLPENPTELVHLSVSAAQEEASFTARAIELVERRASTALFDDFGLDAPELAPGAQSFTAQLLREGRALRTAGEGASGEQRNGG